VTVVRLLSTIYYRQQISINLVNETWKNNIQGVGIKMVHNIYITCFYVEIQAKNSSTNLRLTLGNLLQLEWKTTFN
jgi:hypothetical protein